MEFPELEAIERDGSERISGVATLQEFQLAETELFGKNSRLAVLHKQLGTVEPDQRKSLGQAINDLKGRMLAVASARKEELQAQERKAKLEADWLDLTEVVGESSRGHLHLVTQTRERLEDVFIGMGYSVAEGPEVETDWYNFEALNFPPGHPARTMHDTFHVNLGEPESTLLRTHTSPVQVRLMQSQPPPIYSVMPGRCYRRDPADGRHLPVFHQIEGLVVDHGITFGDLAGTIESFTTAYFGPRIHSRLRPAFFPFTEPSAEYEITCIFCEGDGCRVCSNTGWIELGGAGMVDPNVFKAVGIDPEEWSGFAFGFGIDRCAMMRHEVDDLRQFINNDIRMLEQF